MIKLYKKSALEEDDKIRQMIKQSKEFSPEANPSMNTINPAFRNHDNSMIMRRATNKSLVHIRNNMSLELQRESQPGARNCMAPSKSLHREKNKGLLREENRKIQMIIKNR